MMRPPFGHALAVVAATLVLGTAGYAEAARQVPVPIVVVGVDHVCSSFTPSVDPATGGLVLTCEPTGGQPPPAAEAPTGCVATIATTPATLTSAGGSAQLNVTGCSATGAVTYNWRRNGVANASTSASWSSSLPANTNTTAASTTTYQVQACNGTACATFPATPLTAVVPAAAAGGTGTAWNGLCEGFAGTTVVDLPWAHNRFQASMGPSDVIVVRFKTGSGSSMWSGSLSGAEWGSASSKRYATLSDKPCDFVGLKGASASSSTSVTNYFNVGLTSTDTYYPLLAPNTTYYWNIKNVDPISCASSGVCTMFVELTKPGGM